MANYNTLKSVPLVYPEGNIDLGSPNRKFGNIYVTSNIAVGSSTINANNIITPKIASIAYPGDDLAANTAGGQTIAIIGTGFQAGATVLLDSAYVAVVTVISDTRIEFTSPVKIAGSYTLYVVNPDGGTAIFIPGVSYSGVPNWTTSAGTLGTQYEATSVNTSVTATGDAPITYTVFSGTLPPGTSLSSSGVLTGTAPASAGATTYTFTIRATDAQNQDTDRTFSLTVNTDAVTWNSPADGYATTVYEYATISNVTVNATSAAGKTITYTANSLPTGINLVGNTVYGTPTTVANTVSNITANAATTLKTAYRNLNFNVLQDVVTWSSPADQTNYAVTANSAISNVSLSATSAAGKSITYTANTLPNGISLTGATISGTPTTVANSTTLLTATAATTNRSATRTITWTVSLAAVVGDGSWSYVPLLLSASAAITTSSFVNDASLNNAQLTVYGDTRAQNFNPYTPGYYSNYFDGTGDYLTLPNSSSFAFGTGDFTIEYWINTTDTGGGLIAQALVGGWGTTLFNSTIYWQSSYNTTNLWTYSAASIIDGRWHHLAFSRVSGSTKFFIDGVLVATNADSTNYTATTGDILIGRDSNPADLIGYISNLRIIKGTGLYTANFTVPAAPLTAVANTSLLICQSNRFIDNSTNNFTITQNGDTSVKAANPFAPNSSYAAYGSGYFDGTGDYLTVPYSSSMVQWWDTDYTIEMWVYNTSNVQSANGFPTQISYGTPASATVYWAFGTVNSGYLKFYYYQGTGASLTSTAVVPLNTWTHIAMVYTNSSTTLKGYINGVEAFSGSKSSTPQGPSGYTVNIGNAESVYYLGYISNLRIIRGTAVYTAAFTPPTAPLTAVANTSLLTLQTNGAHNNSTFSDNSSFNNLVTRAGNATNGTFSPYGLNWSIYFDGASYISTPSELSTAMGTGFAGNIISIEMFVFPTNLNNGSYDNAFIGSYAAVAANGRWLFYHKKTASTTASLGFAYTTGTGSQNNIETTATPLTQNQWNHVAVTIDATTSSSANVKIFANGSLVQSWTGQNMSTQTSYYTSPYIGGPNSNYSSQFAGYMSCVRILKGAFAYTGNYTVATSSLHSINYTVLNTAQTGIPVDLSVNNFTLTPQSGVKAQKFSPFATFNLPIYYSNYFDTTSSTNLYVSGNGNSINFGTSDFTIELWAVVRTLVNGTYLFDTCPSSELTPTNRILILTQEDGTVKYTTYQARIADTLIESSPGAITAMTWNHIALVKYNGSTKLYVNGTQVGITYSDSLNYPAQTNRPMIGGNGYNGAAGGLVNISNLRIIKGQALYTSNFTPGTAPLTTTSQGATAANVSLLTCQSSTLIDTSPSYNTIVASGAVKPMPVSPFTPTANSAADYSPTVFGGSAYFDGTGDYLAVANNVSHGTLGTSDFTLECWFYHTSLPAANQYIVSHRLAGYIPFLFWTATSTLTYYVSSTNSSWDLVNGQPLGTVVANQWYHLAFTRSGSTFRVFVNGVQAHTFTSSNAFTATTNTLNIGASASDTNAPFFGYITDVRLLRGLSLYNANFYTPVSPLTPTVTAGNVTATSGVLLNGTAGGIIDATRTVDLETVGDAKAVQFSPYSGSYYSNLFGSGNYIYAASNAAFAPGTGDFTVEAWVYPTAAYTTYNYVLGVAITGGLVFYVTGGTLVVRAYNVADQLSSATIPSLNTWTHVAASRSGTTLRIFVNGTQTATSTNSYNFVQGAAYVGNDSTNAAPWYGYISNFRFVKGQALYTTTFTPATSPLTTTSQGISTGTVSLLTCQSNKFVDNSSNAVTLTVNGTPKVQTQNPFAVNTGTAYYFDGTGDWLHIPPNPNFEFGGGDFTVEFWFYTSTTSRQWFIHSATDYWFGIDYNSVNTNKLGLWASSNGTSWNLINSDSAGNGICATTLPQNQWNHIAVSRSGNVWKVFLNGVQDLNITVAGSIVNRASEQKVIGSWAISSHQYPVNGYMSDFRVTKGYARYTSAFTPPTTPLLTK